MNIIAMSARVRKNRWKGGSDKRMRDKMSYQKWFEEDRRHRRREIDECRKKRKRGMRD